MFGKRADSVVIVSKEEWENVCADVRGLKRLAALESEAAGQQAQRFAHAIDTLEQRVAEQFGALSTAASAQERNFVECINRLERAGADVASLRGIAAELAQLVTEIASGANEKFEAIREAMQTKVCSADFDESLISIGDAQAQLAIMSDELSSRIDRVAAHVGELMAAPQQPMPALATLTDIIAAAPAPDLDAMRAYYAEKRAEREQGEALSAEDREAMVEPERTTVDGALNKIAGVAITQHGMNGGAHDNPQPEERA